MVKKVISAILGLGINLAIYAAAIFLLIRVGTMVYDFSYEVFGEPVVNAEATEEIAIEVVEGDGGQSVAAKLKEAGLINNELAFSIKSRLSSANLMPGTYKLTASMSADDMLAWMSDQANSVVKQKTAQELAEEAAEEVIVETTEETIVETSEGEGGQ